MRWRGRRQSSNVEDRRGQGGFTRGGFSRGPGIRIPVGRGGRGGGIGITGIIIIIIVYFVLRVMGVDPLGGGGGPSGQGVSPGGSAASDEQAQFAATVLADTEDVWHQIFRNSGSDYREPGMVLFSDSDQSACGFASAAVGPFYCPSDEKVYLDLTFFDELAGKFGAAGDFAQAYVIAHEVGHHVQNLTGVLPEFNRQGSTMSDAERNAMSVRVELQADCYAGIWAHYAAQKGLLEPGDVEEALNAAQQIGDDTLQRRVQGYVVPESFNHGTSAQRKHWLARGMENGRVADCDTFGATP